MVTKKELEKTAKECFYVFQFTKKISEKTKQPLFVIFNARNGTVFSYGMPSMLKQIKEQLDEKEEEKFWQEVKNHPIYHRSIILSTLLTAKNWFFNNRLKYFIGFTLNFRYPSSLKNKIFIPEKVKEVIDSEINIVFIDVGYVLLPATIGSGWGQNESIDSYLNIQKIKTIIVNKNYQLPISFQEITEKAEKDVNEFLTQAKNQPFFIMLVPTFNEESENLKLPWFDDNPIALGPIGLKFAHESDYKPKSKKEKNLYKKYKKIILRLLKQK